MSGGGPLARVGDRRVDHRLLVADQHVREVVVAVGELVLQQRLAHPGDVAVAEDAEAPREELLPLAVALAPLVREEAHRRLGHGEPDRVTRHRGSPSGSRGSTGWPDQVSRTQPWAGASQMSQALVVPGPALTVGK